MLSALSSPSPTVLHLSVFSLSPSPNPQGHNMVCSHPKHFQSQKDKEKGLFKSEGGALSPRHDTSPAVLSQAPLREPRGHSLRAQDKELGWGGVELWKESEGPHYLSGKLSLGQSPHCHTLLAVQDRQLLCQRAQRQTCHPQG